MNIKILDVIELLSYILDNDEVKDNVRRFLPALISKWQTHYLVPEL